MTVPDLSSLSSKTTAERKALKPTSVYTASGNNCTFFGISISDGTKHINKVATKEHVLPDEITSIHVFFRKNENYIHSMVFNGKTTLKIGHTPEDDQRNIKEGKPGKTKGR